MTKNDIEKKVNTALCNLYMDDAFLFEKGLCERCINHRFAKYLEEQKFDGYYIDCEYNKSHLNKKSEIKSVSSPHGNYIDIIITKRRGCNEGDLVCFETKRFNNYNNRKKDRENLEILTGKDGRFGYKIGFYVIFGSTRGKARIEVYENGKKTRTYNFLKKDFENIKKGGEIEVVLIKNDHKNEVIVIRGKVVDNIKGLKELHIVEVSDEDTTIRYDQIKAVKVFNL